MSTNVKLAVDSEKPAMIGSESAVAEKCLRLFTARNFQPGSDARPTLISGGAASPNFIMNF